MKENLGAAGVVKPAGATVEVLGVEDPPPNILLPDPLFRLGNRPPG